MPPTEPVTSAIDKALVRLPAYARYLRNEHFEEFVRLNHQLAYEENLPLLHTIAHLSEEQQLELGRHYQNQFLTYIAEGRASELVRMNIAEWTAGALPFDKFAVVSEDISTINFIRKKTLLRFLPGYMTEPAGLTELVEEIDRYHLYLNNAAMKVYAELLQEKDRLYRQTEELSQTGNWRWDARNNHLYWTDNLFRLYGLPPQSESITMKRFLSLVHPADRDAVAKSMERGFPDEEENQVFRIVRPDGVVRTLRSLARVQRDSEGALQLAYGTERDITGQMEAQHRIDEQELFIRHIADASPMVLYLFDVQAGRFNYVNREIFFVLGYRPEELLELNADEVLDLYHPDEQHLLPERNGSAAHFQSPGNMRQYECRLRKKAGSWNWMLAREVVFRRDESGAILQILGAALDIDRRKEIEQTLLQNSFQLEQSNSSLEEFAYVASHDLKEPLRKISTFGDRLVASQMDRLSDDGKVYLRKVVDAAQRMQAMIDDLLAVSRISGNRSFELTSLQTLLEDALQTLEVKIEQKGATVGVEGGPLPEARVVPSQFRQLFQNLVSNSLKFVRDDLPPRITIRHGYVGPEALPAMAVVGKSESYLRLELQDNGIGFEAEYSARIFQIFQRLHGRSEYEGSGIGLAIVKKIAEHHGGTIFANGVPGEGALFTLILPA